MKITLESYIRNNPQTQRLQFIDITKGFLIILVVLGHSSFPFSRYISWFHMPAFFILSGYLYKKNEIDFYTNTLIKIKQYLLPYFSWGVLFLFLNFVSFFLLQNQIWRQLTLSQFLNFLFGGEALCQEFGAFWFIPVLLLTQLGYMILNQKITNIIIFLISIIFVLFTPLFYNKSLFLNIDCLTVTLLYFSVGVLLRTYYLYVKKIIVLISFASIVSVFLLIDYILQLNFVFDVKHLIFSNIWVQVPLSIIISITILLICDYLSNKLGYLAIIGKLSLVIMYSHLAIKFYAIRYLKIDLNNHWLLFVIISIAAVFAIEWLFKKYKFTRLLFLGLSK